VVAVWPVFRVGGFHLFSPESAREGFFNPYFSHFRQMFPKF
jgi:hypothetical protein